MTGCGFAHPSDLARAVDRFNPNGVAGYRGNYDGAPLRGTRRDAESDACMALHVGTIEWQVAA